MSSLAADDRPWVVLGVPSVDGMLVVLVQQEPLLLGVGPVVRRLGADQDEPSAGSHLLDILGLRALPSPRHLETHPVAFLKGFEAPADYAAVVHKDVIFPIVRGDEAVALLVTDPLYGSLRYLQRCT